MSSMPTSSTPSARKVEALEGLNAAAAADGLSKIADHWRDRATAAEAEAAGCGVP